MGAVRYPRIHFQLNLPANWNGKALQYGGGGFNGVLITGLAPLRDAPHGAPTPLAQGYATFGTDSGHQANAYPPTEVAAWALNEEARTNFAYASYKKVKDVAHALAAEFYANKPAKSYFFGGSEGGREGLTMAQRFPADYDGIVSVVPVINSDWRTASSAISSRARPGSIRRPCAARRVATPATPACPIPRSRL